MRLTTFALPFLLTLTAACAADTGKSTQVPRTVTEAIAMIDNYPRHWTGPYQFRHPPGNVRADHYRELLGDRVYVVNRGAPRPEARKNGFPWQAVEVVFIGKDGRLAWCSHDNRKYFWKDDVWRPETFELDGMVWDVFNPKDPHGHGSKNSYLYDPATGELITYSLWRGKFGLWSAGHLQTRLPAAVYTICPDFPSPEELGLEVNEKQTGLEYDDYPKKMVVTYNTLIAQDPGERVLRPDLVTPNLAKPVAAGIAQAAGASE